MRAHYLQHVPFEGLGSIEPWLLAAGYDIGHTRFFEMVQLPEPDTIDLLIVMGGPMSVNDDADFPWLALEKSFIRQVVTAGKPVLGICLGAQLIASAMGARVYPNPVKEIGWLPIQAEATSGEDKFQLPTEVEVFHWHGDTFELPAGAVRLAASEACTNQAFQLGSSVLGLQFHLETTLESAQAIVAHCRAELQPAPYVQSETDILAVAPEQYQVINDLMGEVLTFLTRNRN